MEIKGKKIVAESILIVITFVKKIMGIPNGICKYYPSCSEYAKENIKKKPLFIALFWIVVRVLKCNPFSKGGYDPVK